MKKIFLTSLLLFVISCQLVYSQAGQTGLSFLELGIGGRALGMGEAYTAIASDPSATYYNPAALSLSKKSQLLLMHKEYFQGTKTENIVASTSINQISIGFNVNATTISDIELRTVPGPALGTFTARYALIGLSGAYEFDSIISVGVTGKYLFEKIFTDEASGLAFDLGGMYMTPWDIRLGFAISNLGSMSELRNESTKLPQTIRVGAGYVIPVEKIDGTLTTSADIVSVVNKSKTYLYLGGEFNYKNTFSVRLGYQTSHESKNLSNNIGNISGGVGIRYSMFQVDYAFVPFRYDFGSTHTFSLCIDIP